MLGGKQWRLRCSTAANRGEEAPTTTLDHATYIGPVEIREAAGKGRGLFVTEAVKLGDLLLCEKTSTHAYDSEIDAGNSKVTLLINIKKGQGFMGGQGYEDGKEVHKGHVQDGRRRRYIFRGDICRVRVVGSLDHHICVLTQIKPI